MSSKTFLMPFLVAVLAQAGPAAAQPAASRAAASRATGVDSARLAEIDPIVAKGIADGRMPGAVVVVGRGRVCQAERSGQNGHEQRLTQHGGIPTGLLAYTS